MSGKRARGGKERRYEARDKKRRKTSDSCRANAADEKESCTLKSLGSIRNIAPRVSLVLVKNKYANALLHLNEFSHARLFYMHEGKICWVATVQLEEVEIKGSAFIIKHRTSIPDGSVLIDLKAYIPIVDRVLNPLIPDKCEQKDWYEEVDETVDSMPLAEMEDRDDDDDEHPIRSFFIGKIMKSGKKNSIQLVPRSHSPDDDDDDDGGGGGGRISRCSGYSHLLVVWWCDKLDDDRFRRTTQINPPYGNAPRTGVFASRSPIRPNPIGLSIVRVLDIEEKESLIRIADCDCFDETPVLDVFPYIPSQDRVRECRVPSWISHWPQWIPESTHVVDAASLLPSDAEMMREYVSQARNAFIECAAYDDPTHAHDSDDGDFDSISVSPAAKMQKLSSPASTDVDKKRTIRIHGASQHNLKNIDVEIPLNQIVVITGVSGSGKSSLAFDTLYAESRRRYMGSLSSYDRRLLDQLEKPHFESITVLPPAIAIEQRTIARNNPRSTVGTITEILDYLRLLYSRVGLFHCPSCGKSVEPMTLSEIVSLLFDALLVSDLDIFAPLFRGHQHHYEHDKAHQTWESIATQMRRHGSTLSVEIDGEIRVSLEELNKKLKKPFRTANVLVGSFSCTQPQQQAKDEMMASLDDVAEMRGELHRTVQRAIELGHGVLLVRLGLKCGAQNRRDVHHLGEYWLTTERICPLCDRVFFEMASSRFSFNNPDGMCSECNGLGEIMAPHEDLVIEDARKSLLDGASPWFGILRGKKRTGNWMIGELFALADHFDVDLETPWCELPQKFRNQVLHGSGTTKLRYKYDSSAAKIARKGEVHREASGAFSHIRRLVQQSHSETSHQRYMQFMKKSPCPECRGERLSPEARLVTVDGMRLPQITLKTIDDLLAWIQQLSLVFSSREAIVSAQIIQELTARLQSLIDLGLHYLTIDRPAPTLSGGEAQRLRLSGQLTANMTGILYVLDEPTIGLHARDHQALFDTLRRLRDFGNTVVVVEHDPLLMREADYVIDLGPGAGELGGEVVFAGTPSDLMEHASQSMTGKYLSGAIRVNDEMLSTRHEKDELSHSVFHFDQQNCIKIEGAIVHNLKNVTACFPIGKLTCVTGVSGSGKSSLVSSCLSPAIDSMLHTGCLPPLLCKGISGHAAIDRVINITQSPIGRTNTSVPVTYVKVFDEIRKLFAKTDAARERSFGAGQFSFNAAGGRCEKCSGKGTQQIEMHFLSDVSVDCPECHGSRFNAETLEVKFNGKNIHDVLQMTVDEALVFFAAHDRIRRVFAIMQEIGLGYIRLGQGATTLSGGEAQRLKLAKELSYPVPGSALYVLDEPTTGLHFEDIRHLLSLLRRLSSSGHTIIIIEHNIEVIAASDWVIDLGPEGGDQGGSIVASASPKCMATQYHSISHTARFLKEFFDNM